MESSKMTTGDLKANLSAGIVDISEYIREESVVNSFYIEGLIGILICSLVVLAIIGVLLYYVIPCKK